MWRMMWTSAIEQATEMDKHETEDERALMAKPMDAMISSASALA